MVDQTGIEAATSKLPFRDACLYEYEEVKTETQIWGHFHFRAILEGGLENE